MKLDIEQQAQAIHQALERNDIATLQSAMGLLERAMQRAGEASYAAAGAGGGGQGPASEGTVEGEFREV